MEQKVLLFAPKALIVCKRLIFVFIPNGLFLVRNFNIVFTIMVYFSVTVLACVYFCS